MYEKQTISFIWRIRAVTLQRFITKTIR